MILYSNTYHFINQTISYESQMGAINPQVYHETESLHGSYVYESLENMVNNFLQNNCGDDSVLGNVKRSKVLYWMKKGMQLFTFNALKEIKGCELELNDNLDIILPNDYVDYESISWVHPKTGELMMMSRNPKMAMHPAQLQDDQAFLLFDNDGYILEGTTYFQVLNDDPKNNTLSRLNFINCNVNCGGCQYCNTGWSYPYQTANWGLDTTINANGTFNIDTRQGRIHFSSENKSRVIMLTYVSDGLEYSNESDIKINKKAELALYDWCNWNLLSNKIGVQEYIVNRAKKKYDTSYRNAKVMLMNLKADEVMHLISGRRKWLK